MNHFRLKLLLTTLLQMLYCTKNVIGNDDDTNPIIMEQLAENMFLSFKSSGLFEIDNNNLRSANNNKVNTERNLPELNCYTNEDGKTATCKLCQYKNGEYLCTVSSCPTVTDDEIAAVNFSPTDCTCKIHFGDGNNECSSCSYCDDNWVSSYDCTNLGKRYGSKTCNSNNNETSTNVFH